MRKLLAIGLFVLACGLIYWRTGAEDARQPRPVTPSDIKQVVWFSGKESHGLRQDSKGSLLVGHHWLVVKGTMPKLYAAVCFPAASALVTVDGHATTRLYERQGESLVLGQTRKPGGRVWPCGATFCRIPGLVYLTTTLQDPRSHDHRYSCIQVQTVFTDRVAMGAKARDWHAVQVEPKNVWPGPSFMKCTYEVSSPKSLLVHLPEGKEAKVQLSDQLVPPTNYGEIEPVTVSPGRAIICRTRKGWAVYDMNGGFVRFFPVGQLGRFAELGHPFYAKGHFYVPQIVPQSHVEYYRMDLATGKLVDAGPEGYNNIEGRPPT